jgi:hypothetical protein
MRYGDVKERGNGDPMSVNYYACENDTPSIEDGLHIGKSSTGWDFLWRGHEKLNLVNRENWESYLDQLGITIVAEHGVTYTLGEFMLKIVDDRPIDEVRQHAHYWLRHGRDSVDNSLLITNWVDESGYPFCGVEFC